jgi:hypothetical protein
MHPLNITSANKVGEIYDRRSSHRPSRLVVSRPSRHQRFRGGSVAVSDDTKPLGQRYYEEVEALKTEGASNADAIRQVAKKYNKKENAIRGGLNQYRRAHVAGGDEPRRSRRRASVASVDDYVAMARQSLESAQALIDREVDEAKARLDEAQAHYDEVVSSVQERKADIEQKLKALA